MLSNADAVAKADAVVTAIALPVLSYRRAKKVTCTWQILRESGAALHEETLGGEMLYLG